MQEKFRKNADEMMEQAREYSDKAVIVVYNGANTLEFETSGYFTEGISEAASGVWVRLSTL